MNDPCRPGPLALGARSAPLVNGVVAVVARITVIALVAVIGTSCGEEPIDGPPTLRPGRDICIECGMSVVDERCAAAVLVERPGERLHHLFDDTGCLLDYLAEGHDDHDDHVGHSAHDERVLRRFVRDYESRAWVEAEGAHYLVTEEIRTPMHSGLVAFETEAAVIAAQRDHGGDLRSWPEIEALRRAWRENRRTGATSSTPKEEPR